MGRRVIALIAAALVAVFGIIAMVAYVNGADRRALANADPQPVYITQKVVPAGKTLQAALDEGLIAQTNVAAKSKPLGALTSVDDSNKNLVAVSDIGIGEYVLANRFGTTPSGNRAVPVPSGMVGITMKLTIEEGGDYFITPGSKVVVFSTYEVDSRSGAPGAPAPAASASKTAHETRVLVADALVLGVDETSLVPSTAAPTAPAAGAGGQQYIYVTVALSPADATRLVHAWRVTRLYAALQGEGTQADTTYVVASTVDSLFPPK